MNNLCDQTAYLAHLCFLHSASGYSRRADAQSGRYKRFVLIKRNRVLVDSDMRSFERFLRVLSGNSLAVHPNVNQHKMVIGSAGNQPQSMLLELGSQSLCIRQSLPLVFLEVFAQSLSKRDRLRCNDMD